MNPANLPEGDYALAPEAASVWINVGEVDVWIFRRDDGTVTVRLFPAGSKADAEPLDTATSAMRARYAETDDRLGLLSSIKGLHR